MKEVVHVPTRELAEEVLRVAKENGLMKILEVRDWEYYETETYFIPDKRGSYAKLEYAKTNGDKIITAQEFLSRYKSKFKPIAMRCTQEQFKAIEPNLKEIGKIGRMLGAFKKYEYLTNYYSDKELLFDFTGETLLDAEEVTEVFEEWNEKTFLECCGIDVKNEVGELEQLRKENAYLEECIGLEKRDKESLEREIYQLKQQLKAIEDQPKVGDVCLFWDEGVMFVTSVLTIIDMEEVFPYVTKDKAEYKYCIKATPDNIQAKINELKNE